MIDRNTDVLLGRGSILLCNPGNIRYREVVKDHQVEYMRVGRESKKLVAEKVYNRVMTYGGRFLKRSNEEKECSKWVEVRRADALEKVKQSLREKPKMNREKKIHLLRNMYTVQKSASSFESGSGSVGSTLPVAQTNVQKEPAYAVSPPPNDGSSVGSNTSSKKRIKMADIERNLFKKLVRLNEIDPVATNNLGEASAVDHDRMNEYRHSRVQEINDMLILQKVMVTPPTIPPPNLPIRQVRREGVAIPAGNCHLLTPIPVMGESLAKRRVSLEEALPPSSNPPLLAPRAIRALPVPGVYFPPESVATTSTDKSAAQLYESRDQRCPIRMRQEEMYQRTLSLLG